MAEIKNPWLGLSSYTEESLKEYVFYGRTKAISSLVAMIRNHLFVTLYGRSGIGKTSLLNAGVFPILRHCGMQPISIRLTEVTDGGVPAAEVIWNIVIKEMKNAGYDYDACDPSDRFTPDFSDVLVLRKVFSAGRFLNAKGEESMPVIVLDQFEEILHNAPDAAALLISQLYSLIDDNYDLKVSHPCWHDDTNFRLIVSIREDDLFLFEDNIDNLNCVEFKSNRFRLMPMTEEEAKEVILSPTDQLFEKGQEERIADGIIDKARNNGRSINTLMLSLICYLLYEDRVRLGRRITATDLNNYKNIIEKHYLEIVKDLPDSQRNYLEDNLVDAQGRRKFVYYEDLKKRAPKALELINNSTRRLLNKSQDRVEFIHDQLAEAVAKLSNARKGNQMRRIWITSVIVCLFVLFLYSFSQFPGVYSKRTILSSDLASICNHSTVEEYMIANNSITDRFFIDDCPNLKCIDIQKSDAQVSISNCPALVKINCPLNFNGSIETWNCHNLDYNGFHKVIEHIDTIKSKVFASEFVLRTPELLDTNRFKYDTINNILNCYYYPYFISDSINIHKDAKSSLIFRGTVKFVTNIPDSVKRKTDCFVPFGTKDKFENLLEFKPFRSLNELPVYHTWKILTLSYLVYFKYHKSLLVLCLIGLFVIQMFFWITSYQLYRHNNPNKSIILLKSFFYGFGMSLVALLSFMAVYWTFFNIVIPYDQLVAAAMGVVACLICMFSIYKNALFGIFKYWKENGTHSLFKDIFSVIKTTLKSFNENVKTHLIKYFCCVLLSVFVIGCVVWYNKGVESRNNYLMELSKVPNKNVALAVIEELKKQHGTFLFPFFTDSLESAERAILNDTSTVISKITPEYLIELAKERGLILKASEFSQNWENAVSRDGTKFRLTLEDNQSDSIQAIYYDFITEYIDTVSPRVPEGVNIVTSFSPSANTLAAAIGNRIYTYDIVNNILDKSDSLGYSNISHVLMTEDNVVYYKQNRHLYEIVKNGDDYHHDMIDDSYLDILALVMLDDSHISSGMGGNRIKIYDINNNTNETISPDEYIDEPIALISDSLITKYGIFNLKNNVFTVFDSKYDNTYIVSKDIVKIHNPLLGQNEYVCTNACSGEIISKFIREEFEPSGLPQFLSNDGRYLINCGNSEIFVHSLEGITSEGVVIPDRYKRIFNLK